MTSETSAPGGSAHEQAGGGQAGGGGSHAAPWGSDGQGGFTGRVGPLLGFMAKASVLTVITLGVYRFWMKTRLRQYYWSNFRIGGEPFEYTGRGIELLIGFFIAIFFLAIYLFLFNFALSAVSLAYFQGFELAFWLSALAVAPFVPYAQYRAQRYILSRTRWRGIRFGMDLAAWRYAGRALLWYLASILTLGLIWPIADFNLRRFITNRSSYGDLPMRLEGAAGGLYRGYLWPWLLIFGAVASFFYIGGAAMVDPMTPPAPPGPEIFLPIALYIVGSFAIVWYGAFRLRYMLNRTVIGEETRIASSLRPSRYLGVTIGGGLLTMVLIVGVVVVLALIAGAVIGGLAAGGLFDNPEMPPIDPERGFGPEHLPYLWPLLLGAAVFYLIVFLVAAVAVEVLISRRLIAHAAETLTIENVARLDAARQSRHVAEHGAEGFADALDVGAF